MYITGQATHVTINRQHLHTILIVNELSQTQGKEDVLRLNEHLLDD